MAEKMTQKEAELFYDITAAFDEYDAGLDAFNEVVKRSEEFLNMDGGSDSISYHGTLVELNERWQYLDQAAKLTGRVYVSEEGLTELASSEWDGPHQDASGTYFLVEAAEFISLGIVDSLASQSQPPDRNGSVFSPVDLAYAFNPDDLESDLPIFFARPEDILRVEYEMPTIQAINTRLHSRWPRTMKMVDRRIDVAGIDPAKLVAQLENSVNRLPDAAVESNEFREMLGRYIFDRIQLDRSWPYGVTLHGDVALFDGDEYQPLTYTLPTLRYLRVAGISVDLHETDNKKWVGLSLIFAMPTAAATIEGEDGRLLTPLESIKDIFSTRPPDSDRETTLIAKAEHDWRPYAAAIQIGEYDEPDDGQDFEGPVHPRMVEYNRMTQLENLIHDMQRRTNEVRRIRHSDPQDAYEVAAHIIQWFHDEIQLLELEKSDIIRVSGDGVIKSNGNYKQEKTEFSINIDPEMPIVSPTVAADIMGFYEGLIAEVDEREDEEGNKYWQPSPKMALTLSEISAPIVRATNYPLLSVAIKSTALVRLDDSSLFEIPDLDQMRKRNHAMTALSLAHPRTRRLDDVRKIERAFMNESPSSWNEARKPLMKTIREIASDLATNPDEKSFEAIRQLLMYRKVQITGDTWLGNELLENYFSVGVVREVFMVDTPDGSQEMVANIAHQQAADNERDTEKAVLLLLRTISALTF